MLVVRRSRFAILSAFLTLFSFPAFGQESSPPPVPVNAIAGVRDVAIGRFHTCAISRSGQVFCWGNNDQGQLGDGTQTQRLTPVRVQGLTGTFVQVTAGRTHSCARNTAGHVFCWGGGSYGQLGNGSEGRSLVPVTPIGFEAGARWISAGEDHTCALDASGTGFCWGSNSSYQLGDGTNVSPRLQPLAVLGLPAGATQIEAGVAHSCALTNAGQVMCWGSNAVGQLGLLRVSQRRSATLVGRVSGGNLDIAAEGNNSCVLTRARRVLCWGSNGSNQLGTDGAESSATPARVPGVPSGVQDLTIGSNGSSLGFGCALDRGRRSLCWGNNSSGELGDGSYETRPTPARVSNLGSGIQRIVGGGGSHACAILRNGTLRCWGDNFNGQLGNGTTNSAGLPVGVLGRLHQR